MGIERDDRLGGYSRIVKKTQDMFFPTKDGVRLNERWELPDLPEEVEKLRNKLISIFKDLGMIDKISPVKFNHDYVFVPGALEKRVSGRIKDLIGLCNDGLSVNKAVVLLGGQRPLKPHEIEAFLDTENSVLPVRKGWVRPEKLPTTELEMMKAVWDKTELPGALKEVELIEVDAPLVEVEVESKLEGEENYILLVRPSLEDTIKKFVEDYHPEGSGIAPVGGPYTPGQHSTFITNLPDSFWMESVGSAADPKLPLKNLINEAVGLLYREHKRLFPEKHKELFPDRKN